MQIEYSRVAKMSYIDVSKYLAAIVRDVQFFFLFFFVVRFGGQFLFARIGH